jgi:uncharacterized protein (TIGR01732 family)
VDVIGWGMYGSYGYRSPVTTGGYRNNFTLIVVLFILLIIILLLFARAIKRLKKDKFVCLKKRGVIQMTAFALVVVLFVLLIIVGCSCTGIY